MRVEGEKDGNRKNVLENDKRRALFFVFGNCGLTIFLEYGTIIKNRADIHKEKK